MTRVYVAASSADIDRAERWMAALRDAGHQVTSTWTANVRKVGAANPRHASEAERVLWSTDCFVQISASDLVWLLVPPPEKPSFGAWIEVGYALACQQLEGTRSLISSGDTKQSIFCAMGVELVHDADAFAWICRGARGA